MTGPTSASAFKPGDLLNNTYRIEEVLGRGGTSDVYKARSEISGRHVALKALRADLSAHEDFLALMTREEAMRDIRHDAVVRYSENQRTPEGAVFLVMDFVDGPLLETKLKEGGLPTDTLLTIAKRLSQGLRAAHAKNMVHRDLSPDNVILRGDNPEDAVIIDFGIAKDTNPGAETIVGNEFAGKYAYAAPEQLAGTTDARSDLYSLGAMLLAVFRGAAPDIGRNPMEVVQKKAEPLDTSDVPDPLRSLIERLSDPIPERRFQSADEVLTFLDSEPERDDLDALLAPYPDAPKSDAETAQAPKRVSSKEPAGKSKKRKSSAPILLIGIAALGAIGGGAWFAGLIPLGTSLPVVDPYTLVIGKPEDGSLSAKGHVPTQEMMDQLDRLASSAGGTSELTLATGDINENWSDGVLALLNEVGPLDEWQLSLRGNFVAVSGLANDRTVWEGVRQTFEAGAIPAGLQGGAEIVLGPRMLELASLEPILTEHADCGPLGLMNMPADGYPMGSTVTVQGRIAGTEARVALFEDIQRIAGDRSVVIDAEVLNPALCLIEASLPASPSGNIGIQFGFGDRPDPNPSGRYFVGENPVIDVVLPDGINDGYLWVSALDVSGNVFHLLPNLNRTDNAVLDLRDGAEGELSVRVAYGMDEAQANGKLAFLVDDSTLGKSKIIVLHSDEPLFEELRPTTESASGYAEALSLAAGASDAGIRSLDSRILTTVEQ